MVYPQRLNIFDFSKMFSLFCVYIIEIQTRRMPIESKKSKMEGVENQMPDCKVIAVAHEKGGVGKTTTTVNLGIGLARQGKKVLLIDADPQGDLSKCLGIENPSELPQTLSAALTVSSWKGNA